MPDRGLDRVILGIQRWALKVRMLRRALRSGIYALWPRDRHFTGGREPTCRTRVNSLGPPSPWVFLSLRAEQSNPHPVMHCDGDCRFASALAKAGAGTRGERT
jgi:hypothetical protein